MARRSIPRPEDKLLTAADMRIAVDRLSRRLNDLHLLDPRSITTYRSPQIVSLETGIEHALIDAFGRGTPKFNLYRAACDLEPHQSLQMVPDWIAARGGGGYDHINVQELQDGIIENRDRAVALIEQAIRALEEELVYRGEDPNSAAPKTQSVRSSKIFLVHGRNEEPKSEVALFLRAIGLEPIILHLRPNGGRHLLTKFREESEGASFAVVLMMPDDEGGLAGSSERKPRARQNVVFELGYFIGKMGPENVAALMKADVEKPSDFDGIAYIPFDSTGRWKTDLARELHHAKVPFDPSKVFGA